VRDAKKFASTGGWGFALFDAEGMVHGEPDLEQSQACFACHQMVTNKSYVFSEAIAVPVAGRMTPDPHSAETAPPTAKTEAQTDTNDLFHWEDSGNLPDALQTYLRQFPRVRVVGNPIASHIFEGTFDEIKPTLSKEAAKREVPALIYDKKKGG